MNLINSGVYAGALEHSVLILYRLTIPPIKDNPQLFSQPNQNSRGFGGGLPPPTGCGVNYLTKNLLDIP